MSSNEVSEVRMTNGKAIASLVLGILSILLPFIGLIFGVIGIIFWRIAAREIVRTHERGQGLATSGLICSIVGIIFQLFAVLSYLSFMLMTVEIEKTVGLF